VQFHPDDAIDVRLENEAQIGALYEAVQASGHELMLEIIPSRSLVNDPGNVHRALKRIYNLGIFPEWWKLAPMTPAQWRDVDALIAERDPRCRGVVLLGLAASVDELAAGFRDAATSASCRGFAVGRTIFHAPARAWLAGEIDDAALRQRVRTTYESLIDAWQAARRSRREAA
jgi:5-dehydro-2-deoxygluconokinase